jgi:PAS domain S-box-containing protein
MSESKGSTGRTTSDRNRSRVSESYRLPLESTSDAVVVVAADGRILEANAVAESMYGYDREALLSLTVFDIRAESTRADVPEMVDRALRAGGIKARTYHQRRDGSAFPVEVDWRSIELNGEPILIGIVRNITGAQPTDEARAWLSAINDSSRDAIVSFDLHGRVTSWNSVAARMFGYSAEEVVGRSLAVAAPAVVPTGQRYDTMRLFNAVMNGESNVEFESVWTARDGRRLEVECSAFPVRNDREQLIGVGATIRDVSSRRTLESERDRQSAEREALLTGAIEAILGIDSRAVCRMVNAAASEMLGCNPAEMTGRPVLELLPHRHDDEATCPVCRSVRSSANVRAIDVEFLRADGTPFPGQYSLTTVLDGTAPNGAVITIVDISRRKRAELRLHLLHEVSAALAGSLDYEATLAAVADLAIPVFADWCELFLLDESGVRMVESHRMDPEMRALMPAIQGYPVVRGADVGVAHVIETGVSELYPEVPNDFWDKISGNPVQAKLLRELGLTSLLLVPLTVRGSALGVLAFALKRGSGRSSEEDLAIAEAFAERAAAAINSAKLYQEMHAAEARYRGLFHGGAVAIAVLDEKGSWLEVNDAFTRLFGAGLKTIREDDDYREALLGKESAADHWVSLRQRGEWHGELEVERPNGIIVTVEVNATRVYLPEGPIFLLMWHDVTERRARERFEHEFLADIAHDLQNPIAATRLQNQLMQRRLRGGRLTSDDIAEGLSAIDANITRMARRIDELSDVAQLRLGRVLQLHPERIDLAALAEQSIRTWQQTTDRHQLRLDGEVGRVVGEWDVQRIVRVLDNLLSNAIKYSPKGGEIVVRVENEADRTAVLRVTDRGIGIPAVDLGEVFSRFQRGQNVPGRVRGSGIGLSGAKRIVEQHGGTIALESEEGAGTTAIVRLPLVSPA